MSLGRLYYNLLHTNYYPQALLLFSSACNMKILEWDLGMRLHEHAA